MNAKQALEQLAQRDGVSVDYVRGMIEQALADAKNNADPEAQAFWKSIPCEGDFPTPEEAITFLAEQL
ncbi:MAG: hypothetical protein FWE69_03000 [Clostridiales bacterium]|nr:hypothetical protein [Clostridiales bacterium]